MPWQSGGNIGSGSAYSCVNTADCNDYGECAGCALVIAF